MSKHRDKYDWIRPFDGSDPDRALGLWCERCGATAPFPSIPLPVDQWVAWVKGFEAMHRICPPSPAFVASPPTRIPPDGK